MFHSPQQQTEHDREFLVEFERHNLQVAIELARAEGFEGIEGALVEMLAALEESKSFPDF